MKNGCQLTYQQSFDGDLWSRCRGKLAEAFGPALAENLAPAPLFLEPGLLAEMDAAAQSIFAVLTSGDPLLPGDEIVPPAWLTPDDSELPPMLNVDFALTRGDDGGVEAKVLELQGFPSYYFSQLILANLYARMLPSLSPAAAFLGGRNQDAYIQLLRELILGGEDPRDVVLLDLEPHKQKNWMEFQLTARYCGLRVACVSRLKRRGNDLGVEWDEGWKPVRRIYSRLVPEEVADKGLSLPWQDMTDPAVSWVVHPRWFFRWSKAVLPLIQHSAVPRSVRLDTGFGQEPRGKVLKPLFSFGGRGVHLAPEPADLAAIPPQQRQQWLLMDRVDHAPLVADPQTGCPQLCEVRLLYVHHDGVFQPVTTMVRMGTKIASHASRQGLGSWAKISLAFEAAA